VPELKPRLWQTLTRFGILGGLLLIVLGLALLSILEPTTWWKSLPVAVPLGIGVVGGAACFVLNYVWLADIFLRRRTLVGLNVGFMTLFALGCLAVVSFFNRDYYWRWDWTESGKYSLSSQTTNWLKGLKKDVTITALFGQDFQLRGKVKDLLDEYTARSKHLKTAIIDVLREPERAELFVKSLDIKEAALDSVVFQCGKKTKHVARNDMFEFQPFMGYGQRPPPPKFKGEAAFTEALMSVAEEKQTAIYFTTGHGERGMDDFERKGLSRLATVLKRDNYKVESVNLPQRSEIPDDCDVLVIAGPRADFEPPQVDLIREYLTTRSGKLVVMVEPRATYGRLGALADLLEEFNVRVRDDLVALERHRDMLFGGVSISAKVYGMEYAGHKVSDALKNLNTDFSNACPLEAVSSGSAGPRSPQPQGPGNPEYKATAIVKSHDSTWGESDVTDRKKMMKNNPGEDLSGPITLAVAVEPQAPQPPSQYGMPPPPPTDLPGPRVVVFGSANLVSNAVLEGGGRGNQALFANAVSWVARKESQIGIPPKLPDDRRISPNPKQTRTVFAIVLIAIPLGCVMFGGFVWWMRRR